MSGPFKVDAGVVAKILGEHQNLTDEEKGKAALPFGLPPIRWEPAPEGSKCLGCGRETLEWGHPFLGGRWSGFVRCRECGYRDSVLSHLGKSMITVEPLPSPEPIYAAESEDKP